MNLIKKIFAFFCYVMAAIFGLIALIITLVTFPIGIILGPICGLPAGIFAAFALMASGRLYHCPNCYHQFFGSAKEIQRCPKCLKEFEPATQILAKPQEA